MKSVGRLIGTTVRSISSQEKEITVTDDFRNYSERGRSKSDIKEVQHLD